MSQSNKSISEKFTVCFIKETGKKRLVSKNSFRIAIEVGDIETVKLLVQDGFNINDPGENMLTPLHVAAKHGRCEIMKFLIEKGASLDSALVGPEVLGFTPLHLAVQQNHLECAKLLLQKNNINKPIQNKLTLLHIAAKHGHYKIVKFLIENRAFLNSTLEGPKERGFTPLHLAVQGNEFNCAMLLLQHGARISSKIDGVCDPIHLAVFNNDVKITSLLLDMGANINARFDNNFFKEFEPDMHRSLWLNHNLPLLHYSILRNFNLMTKLLLTEGANVNLKTSLEKTTLMQAIEVANKQLVEYLIKNNANVNDRDLFGQPVLHFLILNAKTKDSMYNKEDEALEDKKFKILIKLLSHSVDINARFPTNKERSSIIHYMIKCGFYRGVYELLFFQNDLNFNEIDRTSIYSAQISSQDITPEISNDHEYLAEIKNNYINTIYAIVQRATRDQLMGLPVDENLILEEPIHDWYPVEDFTKTMKQYKDFTIQQISYLKEKKIGDSSITYLDLLTCSMNKLIKLMSNEILRNYNILAEGKQIEYRLPDFISILKYRLHTAKLRSQLLENGAEIIFNLFVPYLPYHCCENIVNKLSNQELIILHPWMTTHDLFIPDYRWSN